MTQPIQLPRILQFGLRFNLENTTENTISTHIFTKDQYIDIYIKSELGTEHLKNGHLVS